MALLFVLFLSAASALGSTSPAKFTLSWMVETGQSNHQSSLLKPIELQEWSVTVDKQRGHLCAINAASGRERYFLSKELPLISVVDPQLRIIIPFHLTDSNFLRLPVPYLAAIEQFQQNPEIVSLREGDLDDWQQIRFRRAWALPKGPVPANIDMIEHAGNRSGFARWRLVRYSEVTRVVDDALAQCQAKASLHPGLEVARTAALFREGRSPTLLAKQYINQSKGRIEHPQDHLVVEVTGSASKTAKGPRSSQEKPILQRAWSIISAADGPRCPHYPTCSEYCVLATRKHGPLKGFWLTAVRLVEESFDFESSADYRLVYHLGRWRVFDPVN